MSTEKITFSKHAEFWMANMNGSTRVLMSTTYALRRVPITVFILSCFVVFPLQGWGEVQAHFPGPNEGYVITQEPDGGGPAPAGYEGYTHTGGETAVGTGAYEGKRVTLRFTLGNQIKTCPAANGTAEGTGVLSVTFDRTDGTNTLHITTRANATYKGQVGDSGYLEGPVTAEIDYTYVQSGGHQDNGHGAIASSAGSNVPQHITLAFYVARNMDLPSFGAFAGGDPLKGHYAEAVGIGHALSYWAGVYYSVAQTKWTHGQCAQIAFNPPSNTVALGAQVTVKAEMKTKAGESVKANFLGAHAYAGTVVPEGIGSNVGSPMKFTYVAPDKKVPNAGFSVKATSRAGNTEGEWKAGLGTGWNGEISCTQEFHDGGNLEVQTFSDFSVTRITIDVKNGVGTAHGYASASSFGVSKQPALRGGTKTLIINNSSHGDGTLEDSSPAKVEVFLNQNNGTYSISADYEFRGEGKIHGVMCGRDGGNCQQADSPLVIAPCFGNTLRGKFSDPNQLHGSARDDKTHGGMYGNGTSSDTVTWDLGRQGSGK